METELIAWLVAGVGIPTGLGVLKWVAKKTKTVEDDKVITLIDQKYRAFLKTLRGGKNLVAVFMLLPLLAACAGGPTVCDNEGAADSVICNVASSLGTNVESLDIILMAVNVRLIKQGVYI